MKYKTLKSVLTSKDIRAQLKTFSIMKHQGQIIFYHAGIETGILEVMEGPMELETIASACKIKDPELLRSLLKLGVTLGELSCKKGKYRLRGVMSKALRNNEALRAMVLETARYHGDLTVQFPAFLREDRKGEYLEEFGGIIAQSSRIAEPFIRAFIYHVIKKNRARTILEAGCGSGEYLKYYTDINKENGGIAIDIDPQAVTIARAKLEEHGIEKNFTVLRDNILDPKSLNGRTFDIVTTYSNMHYFSREEQRKVFRTAYSLLKKKGTFLLATAFKSRRLSSAYFDLIFSATEGLYPLPDADDIIGDLKDIGFARVKKVKLLDDSFLGIVAWK